jgi:hypothetical protein
MLIPTKDFSQFCYRPTPTHILCSIFLLAKSGLAFPYPSCNIDILVADKDNFLVLRFLFRIPIGVEQAVSSFHAHLTEILKMEAVFLQKLVSTYSNY